MLIYESKEKYISHICKISGLSRSTVFRYFSNKKIKDSSVSRIKAAISEIQNTANNSFEIIVPIDSTNEDVFVGHKEIISGIIEQASALGYPVKFQQGNSINPENKQNLGLILLGNYSIDFNANFSALLKNGIPFVAINRIDDGLKINYVAVDVYQGSVDMVNHLLDNGYNRIAFWGAQNDFSQKRKLDGLKETLREHNIPIDDSLIETNTTEHPLEETFARMMKLTNRPNAFLAMDDETALKIIKLAFINNIKVPEELAVAGMNDIEFSENTIPSISSIHFPFKSLGILAVNALKLLLEGNNVSTIKIIVKHRLIARDSTKKNSYNE